MSLTTTKAYLAGGAALKTSFDMGCHLIERNEAGTEWIFHARTKASVVFKAMAGSGNRCQCDYLYDNMLWCETHCARFQMNGAEGYPQHSLYVAMTDRPIV